MGWYLQFWKIVNHYLSASTASVSFSLFFGDNKVKGVIVGMNNWVGVVKGVIDGVGWFIYMNLKSLKKMMGVGEERKTVNEELKTSLSERVWEYECKCTYKVGK